MPRPGTSGAVRPAGNVYTTETPSDASIDRGALIPMRPPFLAIAIAICSLPVAATPADDDWLRSELIFPLDDQHNHAPGIVECPDGSLLVSWYRGSGERSADDVAIYGARLGKGDEAWSEPFLMADRPGFPDCNTTMMIDDSGRLWLFWPTILANSWESCLTNFRVASTYTEPGSPHWEKEGLILLKPQDFADQGEAALEKKLSSMTPESKRQYADEIAALRERLGQKLYQRLGWQPRCKPTVLPSGRILLPLYTDTFSISIMAISDDGGVNWFASEPIFGFGNIQPTVFRRDSGTLAAYMRDNGPEGRVQVSQSDDDGMTWSDAQPGPLLNPGSGLDGLRLANGHWLLVHNDTAAGRNRLAVSLSQDEGTTWPSTRYLEKEDAGAYHYPAVIQAADGSIHVVYSYFVEGGKSMKHVQFKEAWIHGAP